MLQLLPYRRAACAAGQGTPRRSLPRQGKGRTGLPVGKSRKGPVTRPGPPAAGGLPLGGGGKSGQRGASTMTIWRPSKRGSDSTLASGPVSALTRLSSW